MAGSCSIICVTVSAVHEAVSTRTACCVVISHWFEPVAATVACLSIHCERVLAVVNLSAWGPARALGPVIVCWVGTVVCSACSSCVACSACSACFACSLFVSAGLILAQGNQSLPCLACRGKVPSRCTTLSTDCTNEARGISMVRQ